MLWKFPSPDSSSRCHPRRVGWDFHPGDRHLPSHGQPRTFKLHICSLTRNMPGHPHGWWLSRPAGAASPGSLKSGTAAAPGEGGVSLCLWFGTGSRLLPRRNRCWEQDEERRLAWRLGARAGLLLSWHLKRLEIRENSRCKQKRSL